MRNRYRWMYRMTGLPGWVRFGFSPGWTGRSPQGLGPGAQYLAYGSWPTAQMDHIWRQGQISHPPMPDFLRPGFTTLNDPWGAAEITPEQELYFLKTEAEQLEDELYAIEERIKKLEAKE